MAMFAADLNIIPGGTMEGVQKTVAEFLEDLIEKVGEGHYDVDDQFEVEDFTDDIEDFLSAI